MKMVAWALVVALLLTGCVTSKGFDYQNASYSTQMPEGWGVMQPRAVNH